MHPFLPNAYSIHLASFKNFKALRTIQMPIKLWNMWFEYYSQRRSNIQFAECLPISLEGLYSVGPYSRHHECDLLAQLLTDLLRIKWYFLVRLREVGLDETIHQVLNNPIRRRDILKPRGSLQEEKVKLLKSSNISRPD